MKLTLELSEALVQSAKAKGYTEDQIADAIQVAVQFLINDLELSKSITPQNN